MPKPIYISAQDHTRVSEAVALAETQTAGEIVTILADRSDGYSDIQFAWASLAAFLTLFAFALCPTVPTELVNAFIGNWNFEWTAQALFTLVAVCATLTFALVWLIQQSDTVRFALIPGIVRTNRVHDRAIRAFRIGAERRTQGRTGILIYLSMREHRAEIVADEAIASKVDPEIWGEAMDAMIGELKQGRTADAMIAAVERVGTVLARHVPRSDNDVNELPDRLIEV